MDIFTLDRLLGQLRKLIASGHDDSILILEKNGNKWFLFVDINEIMFSIIGNRINLRQDAPLGFEELLRSLAGREGYVLYGVRGFAPKDAQPLEDSRVFWRDVNDSMLFEGLELMDKENIEIPRITFNGISSMPF